MDTKSAALQSADDDDFRRKLDGAGVRPTRQRLDLARAIFGRGDRHFTAEMIYQETRPIRFAPTLGTIYNTLNEFSRCGLCGMREMMRPASVLVAGELRRLAVDFEPDRVDRQIAGRATGGAAQQGA